MKPNIGGERHTALKLYAVQEAIRKWGSKVFVVTQEAQRFQVSIQSGLSMGSSVALKADRDLYPDVQIILADGVEEMKTSSWRGKEFVNPHVVVVECENSSRSTLVRGRPSMRLLAYLMLKEKYKGREDAPIFILVSWEKNRNAYKDVGLFDEAWWVPDDWSANP